MELPSKHLPLLEPHKPAEVLGREAEWDVLLGAWKSKKPALVMVTGRRRAGKSFLLTRFARASGGIYYQASRRTEPEQLRELSRIIGAHFADAALEAGVSFPSWELLFEYVTKQVAGKRLVLVLDEFPYLAAAAPALSSIIQSQWDHTWPNSRMMLVLSGSHVTSMTRLEGGDQPLFGRRTAKVIVGPFTYRDSAAFMPAYDARDRLRTYGAFGGLPGYLSLLDPDIDLGANVAAQILTPSARLADEAQHVLDTFLSDAAIHYSIIEAIAGGDRTWSRLTGRVGRDGGALLRPLRWLEDMQLIARVVPVTERVPRKSKRTLYRLTDPYVAFWHRFVAPLAGTGLLGSVKPGRLWREMIAPKLDEYMGEVFEAACRSFVRAAAEVSDNGLPFAPLQVGEWWDADGTHQVDVVAIAQDHLLVGECKWGSVTHGDLPLLRERAELVRQEIGSGIRHVHLALFSGRPLQDRAIEAEIAAGSLLHYDADTLFA